MMAVLRAKFQRQVTRKALMATQDAYLLHHDGSEGIQLNCLGLQLMLIRDELSGRTMWTEWIGKCIDLQTGTPRGAAGNAAWRDALAHAGAELKHVLASRQLTSASPSDNTFSKSDLHHTATSTSSTSHPAAGMPTTYAPKSFSLADSASSQPKGCPTSRSGDRVIRQNGAAAGTSVAADSGASSSKPAENKRKQVKFE